MCPVLSESLQQLGLADCPFAKPGAKSRALLAQEVSFNQATAVGEQVPMHGVYIAGLFFLAGVAQFRRPRDQVKEVFPKWLLFCW